MSENGEPGTPTKRAPPKKRSVQKSATMTIFPLMKKYFKTVGMLVGVWCVGYFRFSATWLLIPPFFYILNEEYRKSKESQKSFAREAAVDEKSAVLSRIDELPSWVFFPDVERAEWLNKMIKQMWPYICEYVKGVLKTSVEGSVNTSLPASLQPFRFEKIDLGDAPPRIGGVKVYIDNIKRDEIIMDLEIFMASDTNIKVCVRGMNAGIKDFMIHGHLRVVMMLCNKMPIIGSLQVFFLNQPNIDFDLTNYANVLDMPLLSNSLRTVIQDQLNYYMVLPNKFPIQLVDSVDLQRLHFPVPQGILRLHIVAARELKRADMQLIGKGKSDPYCKIYIGSQHFKTKVIENTINPVWNSYFEAVVDQKHGQFAELEVLDQDPGDDDELGTASVDIQNVAENGMIDTWLPLENVSTGMIHIRAIWLHLSKDPEDLETTLRRRISIRKPGGGESPRSWVTDSPLPLSEEPKEEEPRRVHILNTIMTTVKSNQEQEVTTVTEDHLSSALLMVHVDSAKSLPRSRKSMSEPSPYVKVSVGNHVQKGMPKPKSTDPKWEENMQFLVHDPRNQDLLIEVFDSSSKKKVLDSQKEKKLGYLSVPLKSLMTSRDMTVQRPYQLKDSGPQSKINVRLCLRVLTAEEPPEWSRDVPLSHEEEEDEKAEDTSVKEAEKKPEPAKAAVSDAPKEKPKEEAKPPAPVEEIVKPPVVKPPPKEEPKAPAPVEDLKKTPVADEPEKASGRVDEVPPPVHVAETGASYMPGDGDDISIESAMLERAGSELRHRNAGSSPTDAGLGRMQLTLRYSTQRSRLICVVHKCVSLIGCDEDNLSDPYIRIYLLPDKSSSSKRKTQVVKNDLNPIYDETFEWSLPLAEVQQRMLDIQIKNKNSMFSKARVHMGQVVINLGEMDLNKASTEWYDIQDPVEDPFKDD